MFSNPFDVKSTEGRRHYRCCSSNEIQDTEKCPVGLRGAAFDTIQSHIPEVWSGWVVWRFFRE